MRHPPRVKNVGLSSIAGFQRAKARGDHSPRSFPNTIIKSPLPPQQQSTHNASLPVSCAPEPSTSVAASQSTNIPQEASATSPKKLASESGWLFSHGAQLASTYQTPRRRSWDSNLVRRIKRLWKLWSRRLRWWSEMGRAKSRWKTSDRISVGCMRKRWMELG